jgi:hypothetical protein
MPLLSENDITRLRACIYEGERAADTSVQPPPIAKEIDGGALVAGVSGVFDIKAAV